MIVERAIMNVEEYLVGDIIAIKFCDDLIVRCVIVDVTNDIATFISVNRIFTMAYFLEHGECGNWLESDLREYLNGKFYNKCTDFIKNKLVKDSNGDYFSIPFKEEIFRDNQYCEGDGDAVMQWEVMKHRRYRIALDSNDNSNWYWLKMKSSDDSAYSCYHIIDGIVSSTGIISHSGGVCLRFRIPIKDLRLAD